MVERLAVELSQLFRVSGIETLWDNGEAHTSETQNGIGNTEQKNSILRTPLLLCFCGFRGNTVGSLRSGKLEKMVLLFYHDRARLSFWTRFHDLRQRR